MGRFEVQIEAPTAAVFEVLADPATYADWVVGSHRIRRADESWPAVGASFDHTVGLPPLTIDDQTVVLESEPPRRLRLLAQARPLPSAIVTFELHELEGGTRVSMVEDFSNRLLNLAAGPLGHALLALRSRETLLRLRGLVERRFGSPRS